MGFRKLKGLIHAAMLAVGGLLLAVIYFAQGSFEMFPSDEQHGAVGIAMAVVVVGFLAVEALLWGILRYVERKEAAVICVPSNP